MDPRFRRCFGARRLFLSALVVTHSIACDSEQPCTVADDMVVPVDWNEAPLIETPPDTLGIIGDTLRVQVNAVDPDGDEMNYRVSVGLRSSETQYDGDASIDSTGALAFVPRSFDMPYRSMTITVTDEHYYSRSTSFDVTVWPYYFDQVHTSGGTRHNVLSEGPIGQEFVPELRALDVAELVLGGSAAIRFKVNIRKDTITGEIVGSSNVVAFPEKNHFGIVTFDFDRIPMTPLQTYVIELVPEASGATDWRTWGSRSSTYPRGRQILYGEPRERGDLWFRTGVRELGPDIR